MKIKKGADKLIKEQTKYYIAIAFLVLLMHIDYILTYRGICILGVISEGNPLMKWLFDCENITYLKGLLIRFLMAIPPIIMLLIYEKNKFYKELKIVLALAIAMNLYVIASHMKWMFFY